MVLLLDILCVCPIIGTIRRVVKRIVLGFRRGFSQDAAKPNLRSLRSALDIVQTFLMTRHCYLWPKYLSCIVMTLVQGQTRGRKAFVAMMSFAPSLLEAQTLFAIRDGGLQPRLKIIGAALRPATFKLSFTGWEGMIGYHSLKVSAALTSVPASGISSFSS